MRRPHDRTVAGRAPTVRRAATPSTTRAPARIDRPTHRAPAGVLSRWTGASVVAIALGLLAIAAPASADWTVRERVALPRQGAVDLAPFATAEEDTVRFALVGSYSFLHDGSEIDAMSATVNGVRDEAAGPFVALPNGARVVESDPASHRYVIEAPRAPSMPVALNLWGLSSRHLITVSEVDAALSGAIQVEHLVPPPPAPTATDEAVGAAVSTARGIGATELLLVAVAGLGLAAFAWVMVRRRRERVAWLLRRAARAKASIGREVLAIGPAFDPVSATAERLYEATIQQAAHVRSLKRALDRTAWTGSEEARAKHRTLAARGVEALTRLESLVARLEATATELASRAADGDRAHGVDRLVSELGLDLESATEAEDELARI